MEKKIAVTGASGTVGQMIVPRLAEAGLKLVVAGRDPERLRTLYPDHHTVGYGDLADQLDGCEAVLHLAVLNNDKGATEEEFRAVNVGFLAKVAEMARTAKVPLFINMTTIHALDEKTTDPYSVTKREGEAALLRIEGLKTVSLRLPAVYGERFSGRLSMLEKLPGFLQYPALKLAAAFRPVVDADHVAEAIVRLLDQPYDHEVLLADPHENNPVYCAMNRTMDLAFAVTVGVFFFWVYALAWLAVRLSSPGPAIFAQLRVGKDERVFTCYKFRTMRTGSPQAGTHEVCASYITPVGMFLRKTKIDELPQIINILRGEMSLVGPRPCLPSQTELLEWRRKLGVFQCRPGITGLAQVEGFDMSRPERLARIDARYCTFRNLLWDLELIIATPFPNSHGKGRAQAKQQP